MSWLDPLGDEGERLKAGFRAAQDRTGDELTRRRIWAQVANPSRLRPQRRGWRLAGFALASGTLGVLVWLTWPTGRGVVDNVSRVTPVQRTVVTPSEVDSESFLAGPAVVGTGANETMRVRLRGGARLALSTKTQLVVSPDDAPEIKRGQVQLEVPKQAPGRAFKVVAGPYQVVVLGTRFAVSVGPQSVGVEVQEGLVEVRRDGRVVRLRAGQNWTGWLKAPPASASKRGAAVSHADRHALPAVVAAAPANPKTEPSPAPAGASVAPGSISVQPTLAKQARLALAQGDVDRALALLHELAAQPGPAGQNAVYEMGRIWRDNKRQPRKALEIWSGYRAAHPHGLLGAEVDLSLVETYANLGDTKRALLEAEGFLSRYPHSERRPEVERLQRLLRTRDDQSAR